MGVAVTVTRVDEVTVDAGGPQVEVDGARETEHIGVALTVQVTRAFALARAERAGVDRYQVLPIDARRSLRGASERQLAMGCGILSHRRDPI